MMHISGPSRFREGQILAPYEIIRIYPNILVHINVA
jgi:hypothetical protein